MAPRGRGQTENKGSATQEVLSPPAFLGAKLTCLQDSYTGINGRRKHSVLDDLLTIESSKKHINSSYLSKFCVNKKLINKPFHQKFLLKTSAKNIGSYYYDDRS